MPLIFFSGYQTFVPYSSFGTTFSISFDSGSTYTAIGQVKEINGPGLSQDTVETTHHASTAAFRTYTPMLLKGGEMTIEILFDPVLATHKNDSGGILFAYEQQAAYDYRVTFADVDATEWDFNAIVTGFESSASFDGALSASCTFEITGQPTLV